jgi:hypothetical protein
MNGKLLVDYIMYGILDGDAVVTNRTEGEIKHGDIAHEQALPQEYYDIINQRVTHFLEQAESSLKADIKARIEYDAEQTAQKDKQAELQSLIQKIVEHE